MYTHVLRHSVADNLLFCYIEDIVESSLSMRFVVLGDSVPGKTALVVMGLLHLDHVEDEPIIEYSKKIKISNACITLHVTELADGKSQTLDNAIECANGFIIVFDNMKKSSLNDAVDMFQRAVEIQGAMIPKESVTLVSIDTSQGDAGMQGHVVDGQDIAGSHGWAYARVRSTLDYAECEGVFVTAADRLHRHICQQRERIRISRRARSADRRLRLVHIEPDCDKPGAYCVVQ